MFKYGTMGRRFEKQQHYQGFKKGRIPLPSNYGRNSKPVLKRAEGFSPYYGKEALKTAAAAGFKTGENSVTI